MSSSNKELLDKTLFLKDSVPFISIDGKEYEVSNPEILAFNFVPPYEWPGGVELIEHYYDKNKGKCGITMCYSQSENIKDKCLKWCKTIARLLPKEKKEPTPTKYSNDPVLIKYEYPEQVSPVESQEELFEAFFADFQERYAFQVPYNGTNEFYNQKKLDQAESFKVDMKFAWDKIVQEDIKQLMSDQDILANDLKNTLEREEALIESVNELESENKLLREEIERLKAEVLREKFPPN